MPEGMTPALAARYSCRLCGSTNYGAVVARNGSGAIRATSLYRCSGCTLTFQDPKEWRIAPASAERRA